MIPTPFAEATDTIGPPSDLPDCQFLNVERHAGGILSCWRMTWRERVAAMLHGRVWLNIAPGRPHPPVWLTCERNPHRDIDTGSESTPKRPTPAEAIDAATTKETT